VSIYRLGRNRKSDMGGLIYFSPSLSLIQPHVHNMDGFFFCKLKVEPRQAKSEITTLSGIRGPGQQASTEDNEVPGLDDTTFDNEEDAALIQKTQKRLQKKKGKKV
jgi:hypothetical protein